MPSMSIRLYIMRRASRTENIASLFLSLVSAASRAILASSALSFLSAFLTAASSSPLAFRESIIFWLFSARSFMGSELMIFFAGSGSFSAASEMVFLISSADLLTLSLILFISNNCMTKPPLATVVSC